MKNLLKSPLLPAAGILIIVTVILAFLVDGKTYKANDLYVNLIAGSLSSLVSILAIDQILSYRQRRRDDKARRLGIQSLYLPLKSYLRFWYRLASPYKSRSLEIRSDLLSKDFIDCIISQDISRSIEFVTLHDDIRRMHDKFKMSTALILERYFTVFDERTIELLQYVSDTNSVDDEFSLSQMVWSKPYFAFHRTLPDAFQQFLTRLSDLIDLYNQFAREGKTLNTKTLHELRQPLRKQTSEDELMRRLLSIDSQRVFQRAAQDKSKSSGSRGPGPSMWFAASILFAFYWLLLSRRKQ